MQDDVPGDVPVSENRSDWQEVEFEDKSNPKRASGVAVPVEDDDVAMAELAEPLSPADFAAKQASGKGSTDELLEPLSPADFAKGAGKSDPPPAKAPPFVQPPAVQPSPPVVDLPTEAQELRDGSGFRLDDASLRKVYIWALVEAAITLLIAIPALEHLGLRGAPPWAWVLLLMVALQSAYVMWVVALPDWSTVWFGCLVFGLSSATHLVGIVLSLILRQGNVSGFSGGSWSTTLWCTVVVITTAAVAYGCVRISRPWRVAYEAYKAGVDDGEELIDSPDLQ